MAFHSEQLGVRTRFKNFAFFYDQDSIGGTDRGKPVSA